MTEVDCCVADCQYNKQGSCSAKAILLDVNDEYGFGVCRSQLQFPEPEISPELREERAKIALAAIRDQVSDCNTPLLVDPRTGEVSREGKKL